MSKEDEKFIVNYQNKIKSFSDVPKAHKTHWFGPFTGKMMAKCLSELGPCFLCIAELQHMFSINEQSRKPFKEGAD